MAQLDIYKYIYSMPIDCELVLIDIFENSILIADSSVAKCCLFAQLTVVWIVCEMDMIEIQKYY